MQSISTTKMSATQFLMLGEDPSGIRLELVDGQIAVHPSPTPRHSFTRTALATLIAPYLFSNPVGEAFLGVGVCMGNFNVRRPDLSFCFTNNDGIVGEELIESAPDLAIEVLSPSSVTIDRKDKFVQYRKAGVRFYWIVDPQLKTLEGWELKNRKYVSMGRGQGVAKISLAPFKDLEIPLGRLWRSKVASASRRRENS